ncbi:MAG: site-specific DNA-methyltransferase [Sinobacteraceae bacterium]|nr:site-specific DNA-methyltransferase [Nevskiaceae bacterium]MCP5470624.1 site-specific DNA-methyltransferase [Nevskiaceae bacterium]
MSKGRKKTAGASKQVETLTHKGAKRRNIPTAELQSAAQRAEELQPFEPVVYQRRHPLPQGAERPRDKDFDPQLVWKGTRVHLTPEQIKDAAAKGYVDISDAQLVWRGKDQQDWSDLVVTAPPLYIQEKIHPKAIIDDLARRTKDAREAGAGGMADLFHDFNGIDPEAKTEFYAHDQNWSNRFILGDSLQIMASLAEREGLRGQVQCIYFDPPYGMKFKSNWQVSTRDREMSDQEEMEEITREPEQVQAFRDTWKDGIHSYLTYLRDRLSAARDLLRESGSLFLQIGDLNVHRVRALLDEVFGHENFVSQISVRKTATPSSYLDDNHYFVLWYARNHEQMKFRKLYRPKPMEEWVSETRGGSWGVTLDDMDRPLTSEERREPSLIPQNGLVYALSKTTSSGAAKDPQPFPYRGATFFPAGNSHWKTTLDGMRRVDRAGRLEARGGPPWFKKYHVDSPFKRMTNVWEDTSGKSTTRIYVVQTEERVVERCILMTSDPGDLVLDPTCGSGTTAFVSEELGRRWITTDTSRVALALARSRVMSAVYPFYVLTDSKEGRLKEADITGKAPVDSVTGGDIRQGFVYNRVPYVTLKSIANNAEIDVIWEDFQATLEPLRHDLNAALGKKWEEWGVPREAVSAWPDKAKKAHATWWEQRIARQRKIDDSIAKKADVALLYDRPYEDKGRIRVAGPFTVESLSPHRVVPSSESSHVADAAGSTFRLPKGTEQLADFTTMILDHLKTSGVQQAKKADRIAFTAISGWPGTWVAAEGKFIEGEAEKRAAIFIGPEFGTVSRADLTAAAREALDARFDALIACGFNFEAHTSELNKIGPLPILKAKMNPELHMSDELKNTGAGNLFVVFGEPDIKWDFNADGEIVVEVLGVDVFDPKTGDVRASGKDDIAAWFIDTDYNEESFFVRHAYFMGANDPYKSLKTALKAEIDEDAWATLYRDKSRPFPRPETGRFAVKVINHFGDEVMKVFAV